MKTKTKKSNTNKATINFVGPKIKILLKNKMRFSGDVFIADPCIIVREVVGDVGWDDLFDKICKVLKKKIHKYQETVIVEINGAKLLWGCTGSDGMFSLTTKLKTKGKGVHIYSAQICFVHTKDLPKINKKFKGFKNGVIVKNVNSIIKEDIERYNKDDDEKFYTFIGKEVKI